MSRFACRSMLHAVAVAVTLSPKTVEKLDAGALMTSWVTGGVIFGRLHHVPFPFG
jgi:hypothetical protein